MLKELQVGNDRPASEGNIGTRKRIGRDVVRDQRLALPHGEHLGIGVRVGHSVLR